MIARQTRRLANGRTIEFRRMQGLRSNVASGVPTLTVSGAHGSGGSTLTVTGSGLRGTLPSGLSILVNGTDTYTLTAATEAEGDDTLVLAVTPTLVGYAGGESVTLVSEYVGATAEAFRARVNERELAASELLDLNSVKFSPVVADLGTFVPEAGDQVHDGSDILRVLDVQKIQPGAELEGILVFAGGSQ